MNTRISTPPTARLLRHLRVLSLVAAAFLAGQPVRSQNAPSAQDPKKTLTYRILPTDKLSIRVFQEDELSTICLVESKGTVNLPLIGEVRVSGQTLRDAEATIQNAYRDGRYLRHPEVTLTVETYAQREVSISGQVKSPGRYALPAESSMSLLELITRAQGFTDTAQGGKVRVTRILPDGTTHVFTVDVESQITGKAKGKDETLMLEPDDIVFVPERII
jgi:polysaccharide biosynthesis/export protein